MKRCLLLLALLAPAAQAQFQLFVRNGNSQLEAPAIYDFGTVSPGQPATLALRVVNTSTAPASVYVLTLGGAGFTLPSAPPIPQTLNPQAALDFTVQFQASSAGSYSAGLTLPGISMIFTAAVIPALTWLAPSTIDFGAVQTGTSVASQATVSNLSQVELTVPPMVIYGAGFSLDSPSPAGISLEPQQSATFQIHFSPAATGIYAGTLVAGNQTFALAGAGINPPQPKPVLSLDLPQAASAQQGTVHVALDITAQSAAVGALTLDFQGPDDPSVVFAAGGRSLTFSVAPGAAKALDAPFQTGTTAGTLIFTAVLNGVTVQQTVVIAPAPVVLSAAQASRTAGGLTLQLTGFDNTRTAGALAFTFFDRSGNAIPPAPIAASANFPAFFQSSNLGGLFLLSAVFPVNGDTSQIAAFQVQLTNSAGAFTTPRTSF